VDFLHHLHLTHPMATTTISKLPLLPHPCPRVNRMGRAMVIKMHAKPMRTEPQLMVVLFDIITQLKMHYRV
jgi:hypothetical protein